MFRYLQCIWSAPICIVIFYWHHDCSVIYASGCIWAQSQWGLIGGQQTYNQWTFLCNTSFIAFLAINLHVNSILLLSIKCNDLSYNTVICPLLSSYWSLKCIVIKTFFPNLTNDKTFYTKWWNFYQLKSCLILSIVFAGM